MAPDREGLAPPSPGAIGNVVLKDDFSDASTGWLGPGETRFEGENVDMEIAGGRLRVFVKTDSGRGGPDSSDVMAGGRRLDSLADVRIDVEATRTSNPPDSFYAVLCRMQDFDNFYGFALVEGGLFSIFKETQGTATELAGGSSGLISPDEASDNHIGAECVGHQLTMLVDGERVGEASDGEFSEGSVGFLAETRGHAGLEVFFDNVVIRTI